LATFGATGFPRQRNSARRPQTNCRIAQAKRLVRKLKAIREEMQRRMRKALGKGSQKGRVAWATYRKLLLAFPLPEPRSTKHGYNDRPASGPF
jgi:hypothetical protein